MVNWKDIPVAIAPYAMFVVAVAVFGEIYLRVNDANWIAYFIKYAVGLAMVPSAGFFITKVAFEWPPMHGLELKK